MLSADPSYVRYSRYMDKHGIFASVSAQLRNTPLWGWYLGTNAARGRESED